jgi:acyl-CoA-binding protein
MVTSVEMDRLLSDFEACAARVSSGETGKLGQSDQLRLYGLFCVCRKGPARPTDKPSPCLDPRGSAKWDAWSAVSGLSRYVC